jgi:hypothetical protein
VIVAPLTRLSYGNALAVWWVVQAACILATASIIYRTLDLPRPWRTNALLALAALLPLWIAVGIGQFTPVLVLALAGGLVLHKQGKCILAGLLLSLLALKPQLAVGLVLWMLLRRDHRTLLGLAAGFVSQAVAVAAVLGLGVWLDYFHALPAISAITRRAHFSPLVEGSFTGIASNLAAAAGHAAWETMAMKLAYALTVSFALVMLCRVVWRKERGAGSRERGVGSLQAPCSVLPAPCSPSEYACGVLFMTIVPPYLIIYDQTLIAVALVMLWSSPRWRWGVVLFSTMTAVAANLSLTLGFNFTGLAALATMYALARSPSPSPGWAARPSGLCEDTHSPVSARCDSPI